MSDPIHSWVDASELRRIGELLMSEPQELTPPPIMTEEAAYGIDFEGFGKEQIQADSLAGQPPSIAVNQLAEAKRLAEAGGMLSRPLENKSKPQETPLQKQAAGEGPFLERMEAFSKWLREEVMVKRFFLLDSAGEALIDELGGEDLFFSASALGKSWQTAVRTDYQGVGIRLGLQAKSGEVIEIIPAETHYGLMILGLLMTTRVTPETAGIVAEGLQRAVKPPQAP